MKTPKLLNLSDVSLSRLKLLLTTFTVVFVCAIILLFLSLYGGYKIQEQIIAEQAIEIAKYQYIDSTKYKATNQMSSVLEIMDYKDMNYAMNIDVAYLEPDKEYYTVTLIDLKNHEVYLIPFDSLEQHIDKLNW